jgi:hypothetical protein
MAPRPDDLSVQAILERLAELVAYAESLTYTPKLLWSDPADG